MKLLDEKVSVLNFVTKSMRRQLVFLIVALIDRKAGHLDWNALVLGSALWFARTLGTALRLVLQSSLSQVGCVRRRLWRGKERPLNARLVSIGFVLWIESYESSINQALHPLRGDR